MLLPTAARAETTEARDTGAPLGVSLTLPDNLTPYAYRLTDEFVASRLSLRRKDTITIAPASAAQCIVLNWYDVPASYTVTQLNGAGESLFEETITDGQLGRLISLDPLCATISLLFNENGSLGGVAAYAVDAALPEGVLKSAPTPQQADLLIISAEPGMEFCQFGAVLPAYTREKGVTTAVLYVSDYGKRARAYEAIAGLQEAGYESYPLFGGYLSDNYDSYQITSGDFERRAFVEYLKSVIQTLSPKVIVTHGVSDVSGAHSLVAECVQIAVVECPSVQKLYCFGAAEGSLPTVLNLDTPLNAFDGKTAAEVAQSAYQQHVSRRLFGLNIDPASAYTLSYTTVGEDEAKNDLLEHIDTASLLSFSPATPSPTPVVEAIATPSPAPAPEAAAEDGTTSVTPDQPSGTQQHFSGLVLVVIGAGLCASVLMFALLSRNIAAKRGRGDAVCICLAPFALCLAAGAVLAGATVQPPEQQQQPAAVAAQSTPEQSKAPELIETPLPSETPQASESPQAVSDPDAKYYRAADEPAEVIVVDMENGRWEYRSDDLGIAIDRVSTTNEAGKPLTYFVADIHMRDISQFRPGFGAEGHTGRGAIHPWLIARREKAVLWLTGDNLINDEREQKGILIRDGRMFWSAEKEDTLAIYPDMSMRIIKKSAMSPGALLEDGVDNAYSFGPTLINDGIINDQAKYHRVRRANPRAGIGYLSPGHYIAIVVDGRQKDYSVGMPVWEFADLFAKYGCPIAYNLDGGLSAAMIFMGEQINTHSGQRTGGKENVSYQRAVPDGLMFGYSLQVPTVDDPIVNDGNNGNKK
jgi:hypothetical protein